MREAIGPGLIELIRISLPAHSAAALRVSPMTACLLALYAQIPGEPVKSGDARVVDDAAASGRVHSRDDGVEVKKHPNNVDVHDALEVGERVVGDRTHRHLDAGVVKEDIDVLGSALA